MSYKVWGISFPAIIDGLGGDRVFAEASEMGVSEFILCSNSYTSYRLVMPRNPRQIYQLETGVTFYPADEATYEGCKIRPVSTRDWADHDILIEAAEAANKHNLQLSIWVFCFANGRVAKEYPEMAVENLYGSRDRMFLCFNNPEVQNFNLAMIRDIITRYPAASILLDKIPQTQLELDGFAGRFDPLLRLAGSICFCDHCAAQAKNDGVNLLAAKRIAQRIGDASRKVSQYVRESLRDDLIGDTEVPLFLLEEPLFAEILRWRIKCVIRFLRMVRETIRNTLPECKLSVALPPPVKIGHDFTSPRAWLAAQSYRMFAPEVDTIHSVIHWNSDVVEYDTRRARDQINASNPECELATHVAAYGRRRPDEMERITQAALKQGADSVAYFCHDLMDDEMFEAIKSIKQ